VVLRNSSAAFISESVDQFLLSVSNAFFAASNSFSDTQQSIGVLYRLDHSRGFFVPVFSFQSLNNCVFNWFLRNSSTAALTLVLQSVLGSSNIPVGSLLFISLISESLKSSR